MIAFSMTSSPKFHLYAPFPATVSMTRSANTRRYSVFLRRLLRFLRCDVIFLIGKLGAPPRCSSFNSMLRSTPACGGLGKRFRRDVARL